MNTNIWEMILLIHGNLQKKENKHCLVIYNSDNSLEKKIKKPVHMARGQIFHDKQTPNRKKCEKNKELSLFIFIPYQTQLLHKNRQ